MPENDPYSGYNAMQVHMGVPPMSGVQNPGAATRMLLDQAAQQRVYALSAGVPQQAPSMSPGTSFGAQFQQRLGNIQSQQSMNPYMAQALTGGGGYGQGYLPSPVMMTPPSTGVFRTRTQGPRPVPLPPQPQMPFPQTPFTPQMPQSMFQSPYDRQARMEDQRADTTFSRAMMAPRILSEGAGMGLSSLAGFAVGGPAGAAIGGALGSMSGFDEGVSRMMMKPFQPMIERRQMGAALRRTSQDWVVGGPDLHKTGRGLSRDASIGLAGEIQDLAGNKKFQRETGGMFNREDLMKITQEAGQAGLMDESQDIEGIRKNIQNVSKTLRKYMQLTNDPDMVGVLRELGQMKQFGMTLSDMEEAATDVSRYSRAAGTSIAGIKQMGMMGGATFQQAGLTAGAGMSYGMHAAAATRQGVAAGVFQPRELALMGGVQGMTQRNVQAQAAMLSMPMFGAAASQFGGGGFQLNQGALGQMGAGGAQGMVRGAIGSMSNAVRQGGVGALAMFPLQQRRLQTEAAESMTPEQLMATRFQMANQTGQQLGLEGPGAFAAGARMMFGDEVAEQMTMEAQNPQFFQSQRNRIQEQRQRLISDQRRAAKEARPGAMGIVSRRLGETAVIGGIAGGIEAAGATVSQGVGGIGSLIGRGRGMLEDLQAEEEGRMTTRMSERFVMGSEERQQIYGMDAGAIQAATEGQAEYQGGEGYGGRTIARAMAQGGVLPTEEIAMVGGVAAKAAALGMAPVQSLAARALGFGSVPEAGIEALLGTGAEMVMGKEKTNQLVQQQIQQAQQYTRMAKFAATKAGTATGYDATLKALDASAKGKADSGSVISRAAGRITNMVKDRQNIILPDGTVSTEEVRKVLKESMAAEGMSKSDIDAAMKDLEASGGLDKVGGTILQNAKKMAGPEYASQFDEAIEESKMLATGAMDERQVDVMAQKEKTIEALEDQLDFTYDLGFVEKAGAEDVRAMMSEGPAAMLAKTAALMEDQEGGAEAGQAAFAEYKRLYGKGRSNKVVKTEFNKLRQKELQKLDSMSSDAKERLRKVGRGGEVGDVQQAMQALTGATAAQAQAKVYGGVVGGGLQTVMEAAGGGAAGRLAEMATTGEITGAGIAESFETKDIESLMRSGQKGLAGKIARLKREKDPTKRAKLEQEVMGQVSKLGEAREKREEEAGEAEGTEAERLAASEEALAGVQGEMADVFKDFKPAAKAFAEGAASLQKAMESDMFKRMAEGE